jgi:hypothetical protein
MLTRNARREFFSPPERDIDQTLLLETDFLQQPWRGSPPAELLSGEPYVYTLAELVV